MSAQMAMEAKKKPTPAAIRPHSLRPQRGLSLLPRHAEETPAPGGRSLGDALAEPGLGHAFGQIRVHPEAETAQPAMESCPLGLTSPTFCPFGGACHTCPAPVQAKLKIGQPGDKYEQEADRVAEQVMRMPEPQLQRKGCLSCNDMDEDEQIQTKPLAGQITPLVQRQIEDEEEEEQVLQSKEVPGQTLGVTRDVQMNINNLRGTGKPLAESERSFFEPRFGYDFGHVRVHSGAQATRLTRSVNARAFTVGRDLVFGAGQYAPETNVGRRLLAHELTHYVQQQSMPTTTTTVMRKVRKCNTKIERADCESLIARGGPQVGDTVAGSPPGRRQYRFACTGVICRGTYDPWIIVPEKSRFECGELVNVCANGFRSVSVVIDRRSDIGRRPNETNYLVNVDTANALDVVTDGQFTGEVFSFPAELGGYSCCPSGTAEKYDRLFWDYFWEAEKLEKKANELRKTKPKMITTMARMYSSNDLFNLFIGRVRRMKPICDGLFDVLDKITGLYGGLLWDLDPTKAFDWEVRYTVEWGYDRVGTMFRTCWKFMSPPSVDITVIERAYDVTFTSHTYNLSAGEFVAKVKKDYEAASEKKRKATQQRGPASQP